MKFNKNLTFLIDDYKRGKKGVILEGSSRSGKTFASIDFIIYLCGKYTKPLTFNIIKETYNSFKTTLYDDFNRRLTDFGLDNPFERSKEVSTFKIFNHKINFLGADVPSKFHGASSDFTWYNEALDISKAIFDQSEMRTRRFFWSDYNPSVSTHYVYDSIITRDDVSYLKTTFKDNPFISKAERLKILSYEPTADNIRQGTADEYMWKVYGLGERMARTGLIFKNITWIDEFPQDIERIGYAMDFGFTQDPTAITKMGSKGNDLYIQGLFYEPTQNAETLFPVLKALGLVDKTIFADSASPAMISDLNIMGAHIYAIRKFSGSIKYGIGLLNSYNIHIVKDRNFVKEQENYAYRIISGIQTDEPTDKFNHYWDSARYNAMANFRRD